MIAERGVWLSQSVSDPVVAGDAEQAEADDEQAGDRAGAERDVERRRQARAGGLRRAHVRAHGDVHADEARRRREHRADQEADRGPPAELVVEAEQQERDDRDDGDRHVLAAQVRRGAFLHGARDLLHALRARGLLEDPAREVEPVDDGRARAEQREQHCMVMKTSSSVRAPPVESAVTKSAPGKPGAGDYVAQAERSGLSSAGSPAGVRTIRRRA